ncbi:TIGR01459 family HAD-type hydrolase [Methylobrevis albus]|uniref:TIGR01459 family HAD-type hydrolase n=1 Tax=Methylobrevis albus TaxID=2793297 RepID=A0A931HZJ3_9HYPH|nr:TIGR01459 family HAD-type hydrolase [Methylobrevis albus]MBH0236211.1 TIGR01459 family HAD-type hydrolase [Methylobrevis albus]
MTALPAPGRGVRDLAGAFDVYLVDQFGVLHDGSAAFPGAAEALTRLKATGGRIVVLSNSGRPARFNAARLADLGFDPASFDAVVTSGDAALALMLGPDAPVAAGGGRRCLTISGSGDRNLAEALHWGEASTGAEADVVIIAGSRGDVVPLETYAALLGDAARRGVPCLCTNPDRLMLTPTGLAFGAGRIAALYAELGGPVTWIGKPHAAIYRLALAGVAADARVVCIGDSVEHDVAGARGIGAAAALVCTGVSAGLGPADLAAEFARYRAVPDVVLPAFRW